MLDYNKVSNNSVFSFRKLGEAVSLSDARYTLFTKRRLEGEKLPPTKDAFGFHLSRAFFQLSIWSSACDAIANNLDPLHHGWQLENDILTGIMAEQNIGGGGTGSEVNIKEAF